MRIDGWTGGSGGCEWYRVERPLAMLQSLGYETTLHRPTMDPDAPNHMDVLITQRLYTPQQLALLQLIKGFGRQALVADFDDDLWNVPRQSPAHRVYGREDVLEGLREYARMADVITVSTEPLMHRVQEELRHGYCPPVVVIPNAVPDDLLERPLRWSVEGRTLVGWSGSDTHAYDWQAGGVGYQVDRWLKDNQRRAYGVTMGAHYLQNAEERWGWTSLAEGSYYGSIRNFDIGLAPLAQTALNASKSHIKALEYMALGVLPLVSQSAAYAPLHLAPSLVVRPGERWDQALQRVTRMAQEVRRDHLVRNRAIAASYSESRVAPLWQEAVELAHAQYVLRKEAA